MNDDPQHWTTSLHGTVSTTRKPFPTQEEWLAGRRAEWQASGSELDFDAWQTVDQKRRQAENRRRMLEEWETEQRQGRIERLCRQTPARYANATTDEPTLTRWVDKLIELDRAQDTTGPSLLITGPTGTGKTHAMFATLRRYTEGNGRRDIRAVTAADLFARLRPQPGQNSEEMFAGYANAPLLAIDDLGAAKSSEWTDEINYRLFNHRYNAALPTIVTTNLPPRDLGAAIGERVASRLAEMAETLVLKGNDRRRKAA